jgi:hypothetical protein
MRIARWFVGTSVIATLGAMGIAAGCSSGSSSAPATGSDASAEGATGDGGSGGDAGCYVDASLTMFAESDAAGASCAACVNTQCTTSIEACSTSCTCISFFTCLADAGVSATNLGATSPASVSDCVPASGAGPLLNDPGVQGVYQCFTATCGAACGVLLEAGAAGDDGGEAGPADGGVVTDGGGVPTDAGADAADAGG